MSARNLTKPFSIAGFILGEIYLIFAALAPYPNGVEVQLSGKIWRILVGSLFLGPFGAVAGMGVVVGSGAQSALQTPQVSLEALIARVKFL
jgi:hypothetical protein